MTVWALTNTGELQPLEATEWSAQWFTATCYEGHKFCSFDNNGPCAVEEGVGE